MCKPITACDSYVPDCSGVKNGRGSNSYCGTDCQWHRPNDPLPDLIGTLENEIKDTLYFSTKTFTLEHCGVVEGSVDATGETGPFTRKMLFFPTNVHNLGESFVPPPQDKRPDLFVWGQCHGHNHFLSFAKFGLYDIESEAPVTSERFSKLAYCMEDSEAWLIGDKIPCDGTSTCSDQGLSRGFSDYYPSDLDGQWIDITHISAGWYEYRVNVNYARVFHERSFENNINKFPIYVNPDMTDGVVKNYQQMLDISNACEIQNLPPGPVPDDCL